LVDKSYSLALDDLTSEKFLNLDKGFSQKESAFKKPTFESDEAAFKWSKSEYKEPRIFTMKQIRDIFFSLLNQSKAQDRICDGEDNIRRLWDKCKSLTETCE
jgi:hypothetical protein